MATAVDAPSRDRVEILGVPVDRVTMAQALDSIESFIASRIPHIVVTADASGIVAAQSDPEFLALLKEADLVTPDSSGVLWASRRLGRPIAARVSGVDLVERLCGLSADKGYRLFFLGAEPGVAEMAAERLRIRFPGCNIVGTRHGYFPPESDQVVAREVAEFKPDVLFVAMGIPRQEKFIRATAKIIQAPVAMGVGGSFDVFSGRTKRAPRLFQALKLEWLWRVILDPRKISKVRSLPVFVRLVLRSRP
ncbi:MAG TPA: WecB/TagA/CpsF family glycosyltransferase [Fimbriimonadaceae bacterium]|nr:WecB/TagA/CpsF family glycosyltransferase [Fimbriimonadaceae bacterium]